MNLKDSVLEHKSCGVRESQQNQQKVGQQNVNPRHPHLGIPFLMTP
jgi:hypothetical protein